MIYLDHHASTPCDEHVLMTMLPYFCEEFGNPSSQHASGKKAQAAVERARANIATLIGVDECKDIIFTSGATESNNLVIKGFVEAAQDRPTVILTASIEHKSVLDCVKQLANGKAQVLFVQPDEYGQISASKVEKALETIAHLKDARLLASIMYANNEVGTINPIRAIADVVHDFGGYLHVDAAQAVGKVHVDVEDDAIDFMSFSGHKMYGPKGIGALYLNRRKCELTPQCYGGGQECGLRPGTLAVPLIVGLGEAARIASNQLLADEDAAIQLREQLWKGLSEVGTVRLNGHPSARLSCNLNVTFLDLEPEFIDIALKDVAVSKSSACFSGKVQPSYVLTAMGRSSEEALRSVRFGIGRNNTREEMDQVVQLMGVAHRRFAKASREIRV